MLCFDEDAYFWEIFDDDIIPVSKQYCHIKFDPAHGGKLSFFKEALFSESLNSTKTEYYNILFAQTSKNEKLTLINISINIKSTYAKGDSQIDIRHYTSDIDYIIQGHWFRNSIYFDIFYVRYSYFEKWLNQKFILEYINKDNDKFGIVLKRPKSIIGNGKELSFNINNKQKRISSSREINISNNNVLAISKNGNFDVKSTFDIINKIKYFVEIAIYTSPENIFIEDLYFSIDNKFKQKEEIKIFFKQSNYTPENDDTDIDFLFTLNDIHHNFTDIINKWVGLFNNYENEISGFCEVTSDKSNKLNAYSHFFKIVSSIEGFHKKNSNGLITNNRTTLEKRLNDLIRRYKIQTIIDIELDKIQVIIKFIIKTRNSIAHSNTKGTIIIDDKLIGSVNFLTIVYMIIIFITIDLSEELLKQIIRKKFMDIIKFINKCF